MPAQKGFIVYATYLATENETSVYLYGRLENRDSFVTINAIEPYFYLSEKDAKKNEQYLTKYKAEKTKLITFDKQEVVKISHPSHIELTKLTSFLHEKKINTYEADLKPHTRFIIDNDFKGTISITGDYEKAERIDRIYRQPELKPSEGKIKLRTLSLDIESDKELDKLFCIGLYSEKYKQVFIVSKKRLAHATPCADEAECLRKVRDKIIELDPDIITGWNLPDFDFPYLKKKYEEHNMPFDIGRDNSQIKMRQGADFFKKSTVTITGRQVLDGLSMIKDPFIKEAPSIKNIDIKSWTLEDVSQAILGEGKLISGSNRHKKIESWFNEGNHQELVNYNLQDCKLAYDLLQKTKTLDLAMERSELTGVTLDKITGSVVAFDSLYIREATKRGLVSPTTRYSHKEESLKGGYVMDSNPGIYHNVLVLDFKSLYPSLIRTYNIDPASYLENPAKEKTVKAPNGAHFRNEDGILPGIIAKLHEAREKAKKENKEFASYAIKIIMNCFSPDTEVLTENGLKNIEKVSVGERVYCINTKNNQTELHPVTKKFFYPYAGKMIRIKSSVVDYLVTPNHRFLVDFGEGYEWKEASELIKNKKNFWLPEHAKITGKLVSEIRLEELCQKHGITYRKKGNKLQAAPKHSSINPIFGIEDWLEFLGWYLSEGHIYTSKPKRYAGKASWRGKTKVVMINQKIRDNREKIEKLLTRMGLKYCKQSNGISVNNHILANILEKECGIGSNSKRIPDWAYSLDHSLLISLFNSMMLGDGDNRGDRYSTKCEMLAKDFLRLIHHIGIYGFVYSDKFKYLNEDYTMFRVQVNRNRGIRPHISPKRNMSSEEFSGEVLCIEVPPYHTVLAGRKTKLNFCGQSFFGVLANANCRYFSLDVANAITHFAQATIKLTAQKVREMGYEVIYSDTDSVFINTKLENKDKARKVGEELTEHINKFYTGYIKETYKRNSFLEIEFKRHYLSFMIPPLRATEKSSKKGSKKRYAGLIEEKGKEQLEIVGLEAIRGDWTEAAQEFQKQLLFSIFHRKEFVKFIRDFVSNLKAGKMDEKLVYRKSIRKSLEEYTKTTPPHVKAARKLEKLEGSVIEYIITENGPEPIQKIKHKIDYEHYINKQIAPIANTLLFFFNKKFEEIIEGSSQTRLFA